MMQQKVARREKEMLAEVIDRTMLPLCTTARERGSLSLSLFACGSKTYMKRCTRENSKYSILVLSAPPLLSPSTFACYFHLFHLLSSYSKSVEHREGKKKECCWRAIFCFNKSERVREKGMGKRMPWKSEQELWHQEGRQVM